MDSEVIKRIVIKVNSLCELKDHMFLSDQARDLGKSILVDLTNCCRKSQTLAVAIIMHLNDKGFMLDAIEGNEYDLLMNQYGGRLDRMNEMQRVAVRDIASNLFTQLTKAPS